MKNDFCILIQGSSKNWGGGHSICMNEIDGIKVIEHTIKRIFQHDFLKKFKIIIIAPEYDKGNLDFLNINLINKVEIYYGEDNSPLNRMISATKQFKDHDFIIRIDALNFCFDVDSLSVIINQAITANLDLIKFIDNWPPIFTSDIYKIGTLRKISKEIPIKSPFQIHPKYYLLKNNQYKCQRITPNKYTNEVLELYRRQAKFVYEERELGSSTNSIRNGDMLSFHYSLALDFLSKNDVILDIACGLGYGTDIISQNCINIRGADIDEVSLFEAKKAFPNLEFLLEDCTKSSFENNFFDKILSFETIEHVDPLKYFKELKRILKVNGYLILSTPQNAIGEVPINPHHNIEYDLNTLIELAKKYFEIIKIIGIKQGTIIFENDAIGTNTFLVLKKIND
jgi:SAM-dependent methyltransferase